MRNDMSSSQPAQDAQRHGSSSKKTEKRERKFLKTTATNKNMKEGERPLKLRAGCTRKGSPSRLILVKFGDIRDKEKT